MQQIVCPFFSYASLPLSLCLCPNSSDKAASLLRIKRKKFPLKFKVKINPKLHFEKRERGKKNVKELSFFNYAVETCVASLSPKKGKPRSSRGRGRGRKRGCRKEGTLITHTHTLAHKMFAAFGKHGKSSPVTPPYPTSELFSPNSLSTFAAAATLLAWLIRLMMSAFIFGQKSNETKTQKTASLKTCQK